MGQDLPLGLSSSEQGLQTAHSFSREGGAEPGWDQAPGVGRAWIQGHAIMGRGAHQQPLGTQVPTCGDKQDLGLCIKGWSVSEGR